MSHRLNERRQPRNAPPLTAQRCKKFVGKSMANNRSEYLLFEWRMCESDGKEIHAGPKQAHSYEPMLNANNRFRTSFLGLGGGGIGFRTLETKHGLRGEQDCQQAQIA